MSKFKEIQLMFKFDEYYRIYADDAKYLINRVKKLEKALKEIDQIEYGTDRIKPHQLIARKALGKK